MTNAGWPLTVGIIVNVPFSMEIGRQSGKIFTGIRVSRKNKITKAVESSELIECPYSELHARFEALKELLVKDSDPIVEIDGFRDGREFDWVSSQRF